MQKHICVDVLNADQAAKRRFGWKGWEIHNHARDRNHTHDTLNPKLMGGILGWVRAAYRGEQAMSPNLGDIAAIAHRARGSAVRRLPLRRTIRVENPKPWTRVRPVPLCRISDLVSWTAYTPP